MLNSRLFSVVVNYNQSNSFQTYDWLKIRIFHTGSNYCKVMICIGQVFTRKTEFCNTVITLKHIGDTNRNYSPYTINTDKFILGNNYSNYVAESNSTVVLK